MNIKSVKTITDDELQTMLNKSNTLSSILRQLGISETCPHNRKLLKRRMETLDITQFQLNKTIKNPYHNGKDHYLSDEDYFSVADFRRNGPHIKTRLIKHKNWKDECSACGQQPFHNGKPLSLQVDHINGNGYDNRLENLRFLCPNCHSQTSTFGSKNVKK
jgi:hypothetical protein